MRKQQVRRVSLSGIRRAFSSLKGYATAHDQLAWQVNYTRLKSCPVVLYPYIVVLQHTDIVWHVSIATMILLQAGTFEEKDCTAFAKEQLKVLIGGLEHKSAGCLLRLGKLTYIDGEATVWVVRSNKR